MSDRVTKWLHICVMGMLMAAASVDLVAKETKVLPKGMTPEKLEKSVIRKFAYINKRLLSESSVKKIESSGNAEAVSIVNEALLIRNRVAIQINNKEYETAYFELKELNALMSKALKLSRSGARLAKKIKDEMEHAKVVNDTYIHRAKKRASSIKGNSEASTLYNEAMKKRVAAKRDRGKGKYIVATNSYMESTSLLKKAIRMVKNAE